jgi:hypothetical protein
MNVGSRPITSTLNAWRILEARRGFFRWVQSVGIRCDGRPDSLKSTLSLVSVFENSDVWIGLDKFNDREWMVKNVRTVRSYEHFAIDLVIRVVVALGAQKVEDTSDPKKIT